MNIKIIIATHRQYPILEDDNYLPVFAGAAGSDLNLPYQRDDEGENISAKNRYYSELTAMYWAYKNLKADYIGLCHYHRYMDLKHVDIQRYDQYRHAHGSIGLDTARSIIKEEYSDYLPFFDEHMKKTSEHNFNMFVMKYGIFIEYCDFLFDILFRIENQLGDVDRLYGYISERLLDVFIEKNNYQFTETNVIEKEHINWPKKIYEFLRRKYSGG